MTDQFSWSHSVCHIQVCLYYDRTEHKWAYHIMDVKTLFMASFGVCRYHGYCKSGHPILQSLFDWFCNFTRCTFCIVHNKELSHLLTDVLV